MNHDRPHLSITLPRNFSFHYTDRDTPKTPEQEVPAPVPQSSHPTGLYRIKRRVRPSVSNAFADQVYSNGAQDSVLHSCESPGLAAPARTLFPSNMPLPPSVSTSHFAPLPREHAQPRTPEPSSSSSLTASWRDSSILANGIVRPSSACSLLSDSSQATEGSLISYGPGDGSCTSAESDLTNNDPFRFHSFLSRKTTRLQAAGVQNVPATSKFARQVDCQWTSEMDQHLWSTYLSYLGDPTMTPFKMVPGTAPPLGVCVRVAREARKSWRGGRSLPVTPLLSPFDSYIKYAAEDVRAQPSSSRCMPSQLRPPTVALGTQVSKSSSWPTSGTATRRRLRQLCKSNVTLSGDFQRLAHSRSPSPFAPTALPSRRAISRKDDNTYAHTPSDRTSAFRTRDFRISLATSTADSMQPHGPLAQLSTEKTPPTGTDTIMQGDEWFNEPPLPFASEAEPVSDLSIEMASSPIRLASATPNADHLNARFPPRLGSPFGYHTWSPSLSKKNKTRPSVFGKTFGNPRTIGPTTLCDAHGDQQHVMPSTTTVMKRRARHQLEEEISPNGGQVRIGATSSPTSQAGPQASLHSSAPAQAEDQIASAISTTSALDSPPESSRLHRRVRSRGLSLGGDSRYTRTLQNLFSPPLSARSLGSGYSVVSASDVSLGKSTNLSANHATFPRRRPLIGAAIEEELSLRSHDSPLAPLAPFASSSIGRRRRTNRPALLITSVSSPCCSIATSATASTAIPTTAATSTRENITPTPMTAPPRLDSPFAGVAPRPKRRVPRYVPDLSSLDVDADELGAMALDVPLPLSPLIASAKNP